MKRNALDIRKTKAKKQPVKKRVVLTHARRPVLRHFRLIEHKHTGKFIHHRHTSYLTLFIILLVVGFFLFISVGITRAETASGSVTIGVIVPGPAPKVGAVITSPINGTQLTDRNKIEVSGTCLKDMFVVVRNNGILAGSTICAIDSTFKLEIQLQLGSNILSALNYDNLNQAGPKTPSVTVFVTSSSQAQKSDTKVDTEPITPVLPINPSIVPGIISDITSCDDYIAGYLPTGGDPRIAVVCVPRILTPKQKQVLGVLVWGGTPPYAIIVDWGNGDKPTLLSLPTHGYKTESFSYAFSGKYRIKFILKDVNGKEAVVETAVQVSGESKTSDSFIINNIINTSWFETPVPLYIMAVAITLGFWGGDIFNRRFGAKKYQHRARRTT